MTITSRLIHKLATEYNIKLNFNKMINIAKMLYDGDIRVAVVYKFIDFVEKDIIDKISDLTRDQKEYIQSVILIYA